MSLWRGQHGFIADSPDALIALGKESASWLCILSAVPVAAAGFFTYNGMKLEQFVWAFVKSEILCSGQRRFISTNIYYELLKRKGERDID